jgi:hypothetical protein
MTTKQVLKIDAAIVATRIANGGSATHCPICMQPRDRPFRAYNEAANIVHGCVDASHTESLAGITTNSAFWHMSAARRYRAAGRGQ